MRYGAKFLLRSAGNPVNSAVEVAPHDEEFQRVIASVFVQVEAFILRCVESGPEDSSIFTRQRPSDLAATLLRTLLGIRAITRTRPGKDLFKELIKPKFSLLSPRDIESQPA